MTAVERAGKTMRILLVDDEENMLELLSRMMEPISSRIDKTDNLDDCLKMAEKNDYHLIVLDLRLRNSDKTDALAAIKKLKARKSGVIVVSGLADEGLREEVLAAGADAFVPKARTPLARSLMIAAHVAVMHLPEDISKTNTFDTHLQMLKSMAAA